ncbi:hypothetical protein Aph01nite_52000 [Acrocarpospora phusangensis]|uniref:DUF4386 domain-containing protein n=1 Tax=Acrocarpospora phusangensis TaxID=1070424 RepID=A0A919QI93_9ACTN|nr:hypothetical protein [Acrocarpospora phusangensis]GIH26890.1 hypothetical protein Aph01nite_52000 [Acrocarpospora phusangensis]
MSAVIVETVSPPVSRWALSVLPLTGTVLQLAESLLEPASAGPAERVAEWVAHPDRVGISMAAGMLAIPFLIGGFVALARLAAERSRALAWTAFALLAAAMSGLGMVHGFESVAYALALDGDAATAVQVLQLEDLGLVGVVGMLMFLGGALLGVVTLAVAVWRSPYVPWVVPVLLLAFVLADMVAGWTVLGHAIGVAWALALAVAVLRGYGRGSRQAAQ